MQRQSVLTLAILAALSTPVLAENQLLPIQVQANAETDNSQTGEQILQASGNSETGAALRQFSGVEAQRLGGHGLDILIRGQGQSAVNVLIDGGKIEGGCPNRMDPPSSYAELASFDKITVIKGVQSLQYGVGGTAGTVLLERGIPQFEAGKPYNGKVHAATNSNGLTQDVGAEVAAGGNEGYIVLQGAKKKADNYKDGNGNEVKSSYETTQGHIDLGWTPSDDHHVKLSHEVSNTKDALYQGAGMDSPKSDGTMTRLSYEGNNFDGPVNAVAISAYQSKVEHVMDNFSLRTLTAPMASIVPSEVTTQGGKLRLTTNLSETRLDYGLLLQTMEKQATLYNNANNQSQWLMWPKTLTEQNSVFIEANTALSATKNLIYGVRVDQVNAQAKDANTAPDNTVTAPQPRTPISRYTAAYTHYSGDTKINETNWNGLVRYEQTLSSTLAWFGGLSLTTRTADETERFMARADWTGNPDLKAEKHLQLDAGLSQKTAALSWSANAYYDQVNDYILRDYAKNQAAATATNNNNIYVNIDAVIMGAEFDVSYQLSQAWSLGGNLAFTQGRNTTDKRNLSNMAPLNGNLHARFDQHNWYIGTRANFATEQTSVNTEFAEEKAKAWTTFDLYSGYEVNKNFSLQAGIDNLSDEAYFTHVNRTDAVTGTNYKVMEPGRNIWARVQAKF